MYDLTQMNATVGDISIHCFFLLLSLYIYTEHHYKVNTIINDKLNYTRLKIAVMCYTLPGWALRVTSVDVVRYIDGRYTLP